MTYQYRSGDPPTWIPKEELVEGATYKGKCRNADTAVWKNGKFEYTRYKFGFTFLEEIECPEDDRGFDVFFAQEKL
jgi:hypothetical protein